jgi:hypothetical protein
MKWSRNTAEGWVGDTQVIYAIKAGSPFPSQYLVRTVGHGKATTLASHAYPSLLRKLAEDDLAELREKGF